ncbi:MAG: hypothetical protein WA453_09170 [Methyloceanibacter sp.]
MREQLFRCLHNVLIAGTGTAPKQRRVIWVSFHRAKRMAISPENRTRFEAMGVELVRIDLLRAFEGSMIARGTDRQQADEWITEQDRKRRRYGCWRDAALLLLTAIAAIGAAIAAWPVIRGGG